LTPPPADIARRSPRAPLATAAAAVGALALVAVVPPTGRALYPRCPLHSLTGIFCPGCGATRAAHALVTGHLVTAAHDNLLLLVALPIVVVAWVGWLLRTLGRQGPRLMPLTPAWARAVAVVLVLFAVARNIPVAPFTALAPIG
jgi:hypothetical protein